ncbi:MAG: guanylate kinase [Tannerellaceae bacterium]|jgi:guanylate kinase|nr:guanylate kinase [Tannerellaceae bacterium]
MAGKLIIFSAPSGSGKSTIVNYLLEQRLRLRFSVSATSRLPRGAERHGVDYYFLSPREFRERIAAGEFLEYEEVYAGTYYGTLKSEVERILEQGDHVVLDVDVVGGCRIKEQYGDRALSIFIRPPSPAIEVLRRRLIERGTDSPEVIENRVAKMAFELTYASRFDLVVVNDELHQAQAEAFDHVKAFLER